LSGLLLDSHVLIWYVDGDPRLSDADAILIRKTEEVYVSAATVWELTIKMTLGKLPQRSVMDLAVETDCKLLPISPEHAQAIASLPRHHGDPLDHLLLAQAKVEGLTLVTHDGILARYGVPVLLV
jgi:PIN domain nuclease of toxin-antitoxin system